tara:strand:+ start:377 stop:706 length:330 start_codon:yes stop_codon:yes gene_type:complete
MTSQDIFNKDNKKMEIKELMNYRPIRKLVKELGMVGAEERIKNPTFPIWLCLKMNEFGLSQRDLANKMNMDESLLSRLVNGERPPNVNHIKALSDALEVDPSEIWDVIL